MTRTTFQAAAATLAALFIAGTTQAQPLKVEQLPRVVITGKSLASTQVVQLPRVVVEGRSLNSVTRLAQATAAKPAGRV